MTYYFSEREQGELPRDKEEINGIVWRGVKALVMSRVGDGSFGVSYPEFCPDGDVPTGTNQQLLREAMQAEIPDLPTISLWNDHVSGDPPPTLSILDMIEFCWRCISKPILHGYHDFFKHNHLRFDVETGREEFRENINRIFRRNGLAYQLDAQLTDEGTYEGRIKRLLPPVLHEELVSANFDTGDSELDHMLETARRKLRNPDSTVRREALEALWDAWERLKTTGKGKDKKTQVKDLLDATAGSSSSQFREALEREARELTGVGNKLQIRHSETNQERLTKDVHVDYLFHRLFSLVSVILRTHSQLS